MSPLEIERRGVVKFSAQLVSDLLKLPKNCTITGADYDAKHDVLIIYLKGTDEPLKICAEASLAPDIQVT